MTDYAALVTALYQHYGRWYLVAEAVNGDVMHHGAGYYQGIGTGLTKRPHRAVQLAIRREVEKLPASITAPQKCPTYRVPMGVLTCSRSIWERLRAVKIARGWTWDETLERAATLLEEEGHL